MIIKSPHLGETATKWSASGISLVEFLRPRAKCIQVIKVDPFERDREGGELVSSRPDVITMPGLCWHVSRVCGGVGGFFRAQTQSVRVEVQRQHKHALLISSSL